MNPRALAIWCAGAVTLALVTSNPLYRSVVLLASLAVLATHARRGALRPVFIAMGLASTGALVINSLLGHAGDHVLATLPAWLPVVGGAITIEALAAGAASALGLCSALAAAAPLAAALEPHELVAALPGPLHRTGVAISASLNMVPALGRSYLAIREAQRLRGLGRRGQSLRSVLLPTMLTALESSIDLAEAMTARAFGTGPRTAFGRAGWTAFDRLVVLSAGLPVSLLVWQLMLGRLLDWYPYPSLTFPAVDPIVVFACLLLALPALRWPPR